MIRVFVAAFLLFAAPAMAVNPDEVLEDAALEARARALSKELRCVEDRAGMMTKFDSNINALRSSVMPVDHPPRNERRTSGLASSASPVSV